MEYWSTLDQYLILQYLILPVAAVSKIGFFVYMKNVLLRKNSVKLIYLVVRKININVITSIWRKICWCFDEFFLSLQNSAYHLAPRTYHSITHIFSYFLQIQFDEFFLFSNQNQVFSNTCMINSKYKKPPSHSSILIDLKTLDFSCGLKFFFFWFFFKFILWFYLCNSWLVISNSVTSQQSHHLHVRKHKQSLLSKSC